VSKTITVFIPYQDKNMVFLQAEMLIDESDYSLFSDSRLCVFQSIYTNYACCGTKQIHRIIMGHPQGLVVHHKNRNGLDNRRENLLVLTYKEHRRLHMQEQLLDPTLPRPGRKKKP